MTRNEQDGDWPPKPPRSNPIDELRWETINHPEGNFAKLVHISNMLLFLAVSFSLALIALACGIWLSLKIIMAAFS